MRFRKVLARYYKIWYQTSLDSAVFCEKKNDTARAQKYREDAERYKKIIEENQEAIIFFSQGDNAYLIDRLLPKKFQNYK